MGTIVVLDLMGGVALLLWGLHMVRSGVDVHQCPLHGRFGAQCDISQRLHHNNRNL
jgi:hypothetical protein